MVNGRENPGGFGNQEIKGRLEEVMDCRVAE